MHSVTKRARAILCLLAVALGILAGCSQTASATDIPSNASGDYVGDGWNCRVLAYQHPQSALNNVIEWQCSDASNVQRLGASTWYGCPQTGTTLYLAGSHVAPVQPVLSAYQQGQITLAIGAPLVEVVLLTRVQTLPSPRPYLGCGASTNVPPWPPLPSPFQLCDPSDPYCGAL